ncbi:MAG: hypothetical protein PHS81_03765 [Candidatus Nanoarchaeia archaeon]|nr:hypothetical protein [Candidatus Nanoarchaeia archaeon]
MISLDNSKKDYNLYEKGYTEGFKIGYEKAIDENNEKIQKFKEEFERILKTKFIEYRNFHTTFKNKLDEILNK